MERLLYTALVVLHPVFSFMSQFPQFGFLFFFLGMWEVVKVRFKGMLIYIVLCCFCFFSPNIAVMIEKKLYSPELDKARPRGDTYLFYKEYGQ